MDWGLSSTKVSKSGHSRQITSATSLRPSDLRFQQQTGSYFSFFSSINGFSHWLCHVRNIWLYCWAVKHYSSYGRLSESTSGALWPVGTSHGDGQWQVFSNTPQHSCSFHCHHTTRNWKFMWLRPPYKLFFSFCSFFLWKITILIKMSYARWVADCSMEISQVGSKHSSVNKTEYSPTNMHSCGRTWNRVWRSCFKTSALG